MKSRSSRVRTYHERSVVGFRLHDTQYAVDVHDVWQVVQPLPLTCLPHNSSAIVGVAEHRQIIVPILDLRRYFGLPTQDSRQTKWLLLCVDDVVMGVVVDAVTGVFGFEDKDIRPLPALGLQHAHRVLEGVISREAQMVFLLGASLLHEMAQPAINESTSILPSLSSDSIESE